MTEFDIIVDVGRGRPIARAQGDPFVREDHDPASIVRAQVAWVSVEEDSERAVRWDNLHIVAGNPEEVTREIQDRRRSLLPPNFVTLDFPAAFS